MFDPGIGDLKRGVERPRTAVKIASGAEVSVRSKQDLSGSVVPWRSGQSDHRTVLRIRHRDSAGLTHRSSKLRRQAGITQYN